MAEPLITGNCIFHLSNGYVLYSEGVDCEVADNAVVKFDLAKSANLVQVMGPHGERGIQAFKASVYYRGSRLEVKRRDIVAIQNVNDAQLLANIRQAITGIDIVADLPIGIRK